MRHVRFEIANSSVESLGRLRCSRRKEFKRKRGRIPAHDIRDVHEFRSYLRSCRDFWSTDQTSRFGAARPKIDKHLRYRRDVGGCGPATTANQSSASFCYLPRGFGEIIRCGRIDIPTFGVARVYGVRIGRQQIAAGRQFLEQLDHRSRAVEAIGANDLCPELAASRERLDQRRPRLESRLGLAGEQSDNDAIALRSRVKRNLHFFEVLKRLEKDQVDIRLDQRRHLLAKTFAAIDSALFRLVAADSKRTYASGDANSFLSRSFSRQPRSRFVYVGNPVLQSEARKSHRIRAKRI